MRARLFCDALEVHAFLFCSLATLVNEVRDLVGWKAESLERYRLPEVALVEWLESRFDVANVPFLATANASRMVIDVALEALLLRREVENALELVECALDPNALLDWLSTLAIEGNNSVVAAAMPYHSNINS